jgi:fumarate reductase flavoprotein subunit
MDADVVIVGGGLAGLVTATRAGELGLKALVLEAGADADYLCNSRMTGGVIHFASEGMLEPAETLVDKIVNITGNFVDRKLITPFARDTRRAIDWLKTQDARFTRLSAHPRHEFIMAPLRMARPAFQADGWKGRAGDAMLKLLSAKLRKLGGKLILNTRAQRLLFDGDRCVGVAALSGGQPVEYRGRFVVLADGGFQADPELVGRFISKRPERIMQRNARTGRGDAVRMLETAGVKLTGMKYFYGHLLSRDAMTRDNLWPYPGLDSLATAGMVVNGRGARFLDEGLGGVYITNAIAWSDDPLDTWVIFDEDIWNGPGRAELFQIAANPGLATAKGTIFKADNLEQLAAQAGLPAAQLAGTVREFNAAIEGKTLGALSPGRSIHSFAAMPIRKAPFYAVPMCAGLTFTMGGGAVDENMRFLRADGTAVPGLIGAGKSVGGLEGGEPVGYVGGLSLGLITGLRAAEYMAGATSGQT